MLCFRTRLNSVSCLGPKGNVPKCRGICIIIAINADPGDCIFLINRRSWGRRTGILYICFITHSLLIDGRNWGTARTSRSAGWSDATSEILDSITRSAWVLFKVISAEKDRRSLVRLISKCGREYLHGCRNSVNLNLGTCERIAADLLSDYLRRFAASILK